MDDAKGTLANLMRQQDKNLAKAIARGGCCWCASCGHHIPDNRSVFGIPAGSPRTTYPDHYCYGCTRRLNVKRQFGG